MNNMVTENGKASTITPSACLPNLLPITMKSTKGIWYEHTPIPEFTAVQFTQQWIYEDYVHIGVSDAVLEQYRFIGAIQSDDNPIFGLDRIVRADWLATEGRTIYEYTEHAHRVKREADGTLSVTLVSPDEAVPPWPEDEYETNYMEWKAIAPEAFRPHLLPIYSICSGDTLPEGFHQMTVESKTDSLEFLYIDVPNDEISQWALLGNYEKDWNRGGSSYLDIQHIARLPLEWGEQIAHQIYREPSTGMFGVRDMHTNPDTLIRGQVVKCLADIKDNWREDEYCLRAGDILIIDQPAAEPDEYRVYQRVPTSEFYGGRKLIFQRVHRAQMEVLDEVVVFTE